MTEINIDVLREAIRICRTSALYQTMNKRWKREAIMHAYRILMRREL